MDWIDVKKGGSHFEVDGVKFVEFLTGPQGRRGVFVGPGTLHRHYGFQWFFNQRADMTREQAAKTLLVQYPFILIDHRAKLLPLGRLDAIGNDTKVVPGEILVCALNDQCTMRELVV